jgi:hypothetical protein
VHCLVMLLCDFSHHLEIIVRYQPMMHIVCNTGNFLDN